jgi:hypothetical protein
MADKLMYPIGSFKYANRMMKAGDDPVLMNARDQRLYEALGKVSSRPAHVVRAMGEALLEAKDTPFAAKPAAKRKTPRKRTRKAK